MHDDATPSTVQSLAVAELVTLPAEIDVSNASEVRESIGAAFGLPVAVVVADLTKSVFCDSAGARELLLRIYPTMGAALTGSPVSDARSARTGLGRVWLVSAFRSRASPVSPWPPIRGSRQG